MHAAGQREADKMHELFFGVPARTRTRKVTPRPESSGPRVDLFLFIIILPIIVWSLNRLLGGAVLLREIRTQVTVNAVREALGSVIRTDFSPAVAANCNGSQVYPGLAVIREGQAIGDVVNGLADSSHDAILFYLVSFHIWTNSGGLAGIYRNDLKRDARYGKASPRTTGIYNTLRSVHQDAKKLHDGYKLFDRGLDTAVEEALTDFKQLTEKLGDLVHIEDEQNPWYDWMHFGRGAREQQL